MMDVGSRRVQYWSAAAVWSASVATGVSFSWATPVIPKFSKNEVTFQINSSEMSWMAAISSLGFITGSLVSRFSSDRMGRRGSILLSALPVTIGAVLTTIAWEAWLLCIARFLWGIGSGIISNVSIMYITEIASKDIRGNLSVANRYMMSFGCLLVIAVGAFVSYATLNYITLVLPLGFFVACWWIPESPYFLIKEGKVEETRKTLMLLNGIKDEEVIEKQLSQMKADVKIEMSRSGSLKELLTRKQYRKAIAIVAAVRLTQISSGLHPIQNYLGLIIIESKSGMNVTSAIIIFGAIRFLLGIASSLLVDRVGRRPLLIYSFAGSAFLLAGVGTYFFIPKDPNEIGIYSHIPFIGIILSLTVAVLGYESIAYVVPAELFPLNVKSIAMTTSNIIGGLLNFVGVKSYQPLKDWAGLGGAFVFFAFFAFVGSIASYFLVPETKGKTLREIQIDLNGENFYDEESQALKKVENAELNESKLNKGDDSKAMLSHNDEK